jgi:hypothetical protein
VSISFHFFPKQKKWSKNALAPFQTAVKKLIIVNERKNHLKLILQMRSIIFAFCKTGLW